MAGIANVLFDLALLPSSRRIAEVGLINIVVRHGEEAHVDVTLFAAADTIHRRVRAHFPRTMYEWFPRGKSVSVDAGVVSAAAMYTASVLQHGGCAP